MGLRTLLRIENEIEAKTEFGIVLEYFCEFEVGLRIFLSRKKEKRNWT